MKISKTRSRSAGFSMIELMTVVGIMVILAGILIASLPGIQTRVNRQRVETFMAELESGLSKYQIEHGIYPQNPPSDDSDGIDGAAVLYRHLSGDWEEPLDGIIDEGQVAYVKKLSFEENKDSKDPRVASYNNEFMVVDAFGNPFRYQAEPPNIDEETRKTRNPTYDIWSIAEGDPNDDADQSKWISNWQSR